MEFSSQKSSQLAVNVNLLQLIKILIILLCSCWANKTSLSRAETFQLKFKNIISANHVSISY